MNAVSCVTVPPRPRCPRAGRPVRAPVLAGVLGLAAFGAAGCDEGGRPTGGGPPSGARAIVVPGVGPNGIFDAAPVGDGARVWMSYTEVSQHPAEARLPVESTRIALSTDAGATWSDVALVNVATPHTLPPPDDTIPAAWVHEVSRLFFDSWAGAGSRWMLLWHRYVTAWAGGAPQRRFQHGWIALRTAGAPDGPWGAERKLFTGTLYDPADDAFGGPPEFRLDQLFPGAGALGDCAVFTEPAVLVRSEGVYVALKCAGPTGGKITLLRADHAFSSVTWIGDLVDDAEATLLDAAWDGFSAPELVETASGVYLIVSPTEGPGSIYRGCQVLRVTNIRAAAVERSAGVLVPVAEVGGDPGAFSGACGWTREATASGIIYGQVFPGRAPEFRLFGSGITLP